jgi:8-oxo-dGTP pyrophosphatase MutT (NUDIX family)
MSERLTPYHHDTPTPLPDYAGVSTELKNIVHLNKELAPEGARRFVKTAVHEVARPDGSTGYQTVNEMSPGVSLVAIDSVQTDGRTKGYVIMADQIRYPHPRPGYEHLSIEQAAEQGVLGRWSREIISGGVDPRDVTASGAERNTDESALVHAVIREAEEEAGIQHLTPDDIDRIMPTVYGSISVNRQSFNFFATELGQGGGLWLPETHQADIEEGKLHIGAYDINTIPEMQHNGTIIEMSAMTAINGLRALPRYNKYFN